MRICFRLWGCAGFAALALWAGGPQKPAPGDVASVIRTDPHTGKLVRTIVVRNPAALVAAVDNIAAQQALPPELVRSVIQAESGYNPNAVSLKGARGLMQLIPETARRFGVDPSNPVENLQGGAKYLKYLLDLYHGDSVLALAAYNAGEQSVARYGGVPPFPETRKYVSQIEQRLANTSNNARPKDVARTPADPTAGKHVIELRQPDGSVRYVSLQEPL